MRLKLLLLILPTAFLCLSCSPADEPVTRLRMGVLPVLDTLPLHVAVEEGLFLDRSLEVELVPFASAHERDVAIQSGELDGYFGDMLIALMLLQGGVDMRITTISYGTTKGQRMFGLVTAPGKSPSPGMSVGISRSTVIEYLLDRMQENENIRDLGLERVEVRKIPIRLQMLLTGQLDSALLPEPLLTLAETKGGEILATDEALDMPLTVLCLNQPDAEVSRSFMKAYSQAVKRINADPESYRGLLNSHIRMPEELLSTFPIYRYPKPRVPSEQEVWRMQQWMLAQGLLDTLIPYEEVVFEE